MTEKQLCEKIMRNVSHKVGMLLESEEFESKKHSKPAKRLMPKTTLISDYDDTADFGSEAGACCEEEELCEKIMSRVNKKISKLLNESFNFEKSIVYDCFLNGLNDERILNITEGGTCDDMANLVKESKAVLMKGLPKECPERIMNINSLAIYILMNHFEDSDIDEFINMGKKEVDDLVEYLCDEFVNANAEDEINNQPKALPAPATSAPHMSNDNLQECGGNKKPAMKECGNCGNGIKKPQMKECGGNNVQECGGSKKPAMKECSESYKYARMRRRDF